MRLQIEPLRRDHFGDAARLLAERYRALRAAHPALPATLEDEAAARRALRDALMTWTGGGAVALRAGRVVGYLVGTLRAEPPAALSAYHLDARTASVALAGHAVATHGEAEIYARLYTFLAPRWLAARCPAQYIDVLVADGAALEAWQSLGFARETVVAVRGVAGIPGLAPGAAFRRAEPADLETVVRFSDALARYHAGPPVFADYAPDTEAVLRERWREQLADPESFALLCFRGGEPVGYVGLGPAPDSAPLATSANYVYVLEGYSAPEARLIGAAALNRGFAWARERGYERAMLAWHAPNFLSARFCLAVGFQPLLIRLRRLVEAGST